MSEINSNIGPSPAIKVLTTQPSVNPEQAVTATNVVGGIASVTQLSVSGVSTLGIITVSSGIISSTTGIVICIWCWPVSYNCSYYSYDGYSKRW